MLILTSELISKVDVSVIQPSGNFQRGGEDGKGGGGIGGWMSSSLLFPALLVGGLLFIVYRYNQRGVNDEEDRGRGIFGRRNPLAFAQSRTKVEVNPNTGVTFKEVAGCDQAKFELEEVIDFLRNPTKYTKVCILYTVQFLLLYCLRRTGKPDESGRHLLLLCYQCIAWNFTAP